ncbi:MAG: hypothetical protein IKE95_10635 [Methanobrevibacter sp.]|nr:hypothetical protein [Methanobrevibacter sp.]
MKLHASFWKLFNVVIKFSNSGDYHIYGMDEMKELFIKNGLTPVSSLKTDNHTAFHIAEK